MIMEQFVNEENAKNVIYSGGEILAESIYYSLPVTLLPQSIIVNSLSEEIRFLYGDHFDRWPDISTFSKATIKEIEARKHVCESFFNESCNVVTFIREPVSWCIHSFYLLFRYLHKAWHGEVTEQKISILQGLFEETQDWLFDYLQTWHEAEMKRYLGLNLTKSMNEEGFFTYKHGGLNVLVVKVDNFNEALWTNIIKHVGYRKKHNSTMRRSYAMKCKVLINFYDNVVLKHNFIDKLFKLPYFHSFYSEDERRHFKQCWGAERRDYYKKIMMPVKELILGYEKNFVRPWIIRNPKDKFDLSEAVDKVNRVKNRLKKRIPNLLIIGMPRCATTWLKFHLKRHPEISFSDGEPHFYSRTDYSESEIITYLYMIDTKRRIVGEKTPEYCSMNRERLHILKELSPDIRVILMLRNPVERAISELKQMRLRKRGCKVNEQVGFLIKNSTKYNYMETVSKWEETLSPEQFMIINHDALGSNGERIINETIEFIGIPPLREFHKDPREKFGEGMKIDIDERVLEQINRLYKDDLDYWEKAVDGDVYKNGRWVDLS